MRLIAITLAGTIAGLLGVAATGTAAVASPAAPAQAPRAAAVSPNCGPCSYVVTPTGTGSQSLAYVLAHLVQSGDTVELTNGVYRVGELDVRAPGVTIRAEHIPAAGAAPSVWLDGSIVYRYWSHPSASIWSHPYSQDFCETSLRNLPCTQLSVSYHGDQMYRDGSPVPQTIHPYDLLTANPVFYVSPSSHVVLTNVDPGTTTEMTNQETALQFERSAVGAALEGVGVRRYAGNDHDSHALASHEDSAVYVNDASNVAFRYDTFSFNSVRALKTQGDVPASQTPVAGAGVVVDHSVFDHNGELAIDSVDSDNIVVSNSLLYRNNYEAFVIEPGAVKLLSTYGAQILGNQFVQNNGIGLWFDRSAYNALITHNAFTANSWHGIMFEISARATVAYNSFNGNGHIGMFVYESSNISFSHNLMIGNLEGIKVQEGHRTLANFPSGRDSDPDRHMPSAITFNVSAIDIHANGFYYYPAHSNGEVCDPNPAAMPTAAEPDPYDGCQYMIVGQDNYSGAEPNTLGIKAVDDHYHLRNWPGNPTGAAVPVFTALWKAPASAFSSHGGCVGGESGTVFYRWITLRDFQCTGQESGGSNPF
ncbi:MAG TPA: right-handed parallel beta-helix repeat-containing protein [Acidimicrobiia bacterium]